MKGVSILTKAERKYMAYDIKVMKRMYKRYKKKGANMITREVYEKEVVRMWDSVRRDAYTGVTSCAGVSCDKCAFNGVCSFSPFDKIEALEKWIKEHPQKVKREKFFESFDETVVFMIAELGGYENVISLERCLCDSKKWRWKLTFMCDEVDGRG